MHNLGIRVMAIPDGDVAASVLCCLPDAEVDSGLWHWRCT